MKQHLQTLFLQALAQLQSQGTIPLDLKVDVHIERTREARFGDFACNIAMVLAKKVGKPPRVLAEQIIAVLPHSERIAKVEIAGAGFINVFFLQSAYRTVINDIIKQGENYGRSHLGMGKSVIIEFVSANPTGPLHVGHGRGAAYGAALAELLKVAGFKVFKEYYVNDAGRQMDILATSVWLRYLSLCGEKIPFPANGYRGDYIWDIAANIHREHGEALRHSMNTVLNQLPLDEPQGGDKEVYIDALIDRAKTLLGEVAYRHVFNQGLEAILNDIRQDLAEFGVTYDGWFFESSLMQNHTVERAINQLKASGYTYEQEDALWFGSTAFGDEKDRVLIRDNGQYTYFAPDIAYHLHKLEREFNHLIDIWGADHHGYVPRVKAALSALGVDANCLTVLLVQFATLFRGKERLQMSTRSGEFVTLRELRQEVGKDAARFFYIQRKCEQHLDFDLELAKSQTNDNPVYYIQYAHARIMSVFRQLHEKEYSAWQYNPSALKRLEMPREQELLVVLSRYSEVVDSAARAYEPQQIAYYLRELAQAFHTYYNEHKILLDDDELRNARLSLIAAVKQVLRNGLNIIGVSAPEVM